MTIVDVILFIGLLAQGMFIWNLLTFKQIVYSSLKFDKKDLEEYRTRIGKLEVDISNLARWNDEYAMLYPELSERIDDVEKLQTQTYVNMEKGLC